MMRNPLKTLWIFLAVVGGLASVTALADAPAKFQTLRDHATPVANLAEFLQRYIGDCGGFFSPSDCPQRAEAFRASTHGKRHFLIVSEEEASMIANGPYDPAKQIYAVKITPAFRAGKFFLTQGAPSRLDDSGFPIMDAVTERGPTPVGWNAVRFQKLFADKRLRVQLVFTPQGVWELPGPDGERVRGMKAKIEAVLVTIGRTGEPVVMWLPK